MASFTDISYSTLAQRSERILSFFGNLEITLANIGAPYTAHLDILWDGSKVKILLTDEQISALSNSTKLKYYTQGLGLMKLAMNRQLFA